MEIAIIAHDGKKNKMIEFLNNHKNILKQKNIKLISTGTTGAKAQAAGFSVERFLSGPYGGDAQIASRVAEGKCNMIIFFRDPHEKHPHEPDISMLLRLCDVHNIPLATNPSTAELLIRAI
ncbi:MAG: methylglyoxal synthase [Tenacibaculum sp.]